MAGVRQAVLQFDEAVQVPWRPLLRSAGDGRVPSPVASARPARSAAGAGRPARPPLGSGLRGSGPRVSGHLRPVPDRPARVEVRASGPAPVSPRARRGGARPGGRPVRSGPAAGVVRAGGVPAPGPVRLTRRGRRLVAALALGGAVAFGSWLAPVVGGADGGLRLAGGSSVVVQSGDTVWSIAGELAGGERDVRVVVDAIQELNDLEGSVVVPGQVLRLP